MTQVFDFEGLTFVKAVSVAEGWKRHERHVLRVIASPGPTSGTSRLNVFFKPETTGEQMEEAAVRLNDYMAKRGYRQKESYP